MSDEQENVGAGSETSGEQAAAETSQEETAAAETAAESEQSEEAAASAEGAAELKAGDSCVCPDGRAGTLWSDGADGFVCLPNQG